MNWSIKQLFIIFLGIALIQISYYLYTTNFNVTYFNSYGRITVSYTNLLNKLNKDGYYRGLKVSNSSNGTCKLTILDPWNEDAKKAFKIIQPKFDGCKKHTPLSYIRDKTLFIDQNINTKYYSGAIKECKYSKVIFDYNASNQYKFDNNGKFKVFKSGLKIKDDIIMVRCFNQTAMAYEYIHYIFHTLQKNKDQSVYKKRMNVLMIALDSVSSSSFQRSLPKTHKYLQSFTNFYHFKKFHSAGPSTLHNMNPFLGGFTNMLHADLRAKHKTDDFFPFIWKNFSSANYVTFWNQDWDRKEFFSKKPVDHYFLHFWNALTRTKSIPSYSGYSTPKPCYYEKLLHVLQFDMTRSFLKEYLPSKTQKSDYVNQNFFAYTMMNEMSHDILDRLFWIDDDLLKYLKDILTPSFLENTLVMIMGDHGHRIHPIRFTAAGKLEQFLPYFSMLIPTRMKKNNKLLDQILKQNTITMASPYDIYETLMHLLQDQTDIHSNESKYLKDKINRTNQGSSLLLPLPDRVCNQASIPDEFCVCDLGSRTNKLTELQNKTAIEGAKFIVKHINENLLKDLIPKLCVKFEFGIVKRADYINDKRVSLIFTTKPNNASFEVDLEILGPKKFKIFGSLVQRLSMYADTAYCIKDIFMRSYCYCVVQRKKQKSK